MAVARQVLSDPSYLIGVCASSVDAAAAAAADGASFLLVTDPDSNDDASMPASSMPATVLADIATSSRSGMQIPVIVSTSVIGQDNFRTWLSSGADGISGTPESLPRVSSLPSGTLSDAIASLSSVLHSSSSASEASIRKPSSHRGLLSGLLGSATPVDDVIEREKTLLTDTLVFLEDAVPEMSEIQLLRDALDGLDEPFLLVVVGEFNSGKSTVINALLGAKFLEDGILPTTNEISVLKHSEGAAEADQVCPGCTQLLHEQMECRPPPVCQSDSLLIAFQLNHLLCARPGACFCLYYCQGNLGRLHLAAVNRMLC